MMSIRCKFRMAAAISLALFVPCVACGQELKAANIVLPFRPLESTREEVEKVATLVEESPGYVRFTMDGDRIDVTVAEDRCTWYGWDVRPGTVIDYRIYPKMGIKLDAISSSLARLPETVDDIGTRTFSDLENGVQYSFDREGNLSHIRHTPSRTDRKLRCKGFPEYNAASDTYTAYGDYKIESESEWDVSAVGGFLSDVRKRPSMVGTLFIYLPVKDDRTFRKMARAVEDYAYDVLSIPRNRFSVKFGGLRDQPEAEAFLLPSTYPSATARPKYSFDRR